MAAQTHAITRRDLETKIAVHQEAAGSWHIVLSPRTNAGELSERDLERIAGGTTLVIVAVGLPVAIATVSVVSEVVTENEAGW
jgi:hypothetical protein